VGLVLHENEREEHLSLEASCYDLILGLNLRQPSHFFPETRHVYAKISAEGGSTSQRFAFYRVEGAERE
jgi:hypothetical protein